MTRHIGVVCRCQDSNGVRCGKVMTKAESKQDGMCQVCADNVWMEMTSAVEYIWTHQASKPEATRHG